jgi:GMP synthase-like glutamine amidotransferase
MPVFGMKKDILIVKNITRETPAGMQPLIEAHHDSFNIVELDLGQPFPDPKDYRAVIVLGGPNSANDETPRMLEEIYRVREAIEAGIPYLGICLGLQVAVKAMGGSVVKSPYKEIGLRDPNGAFFGVEINEAGQSDSLLQGLPTRFKTVELHGEMVELTEKMQLLGTGAFCRNQIVKIAPKAYGFQCHFEITPELLETLLQKDPDMSKLDRDQVRTDFEEIRSEYTMVAKTIIRNFLAMAGI